MAYYSTLEKMMHPTMEEILRSEYHRCMVNLEAAKLQQEVAASQLKNAEERASRATERMAVVKAFCEYHDLTLDEKPIGH